MDKRERSRTGRKEFFEQVKIRSALRQYFSKYSYSLHIIIIIWPRSIRTCRMYFLQRRKSHVITETVVITDMRKDMTIDQLEYLRSNH